MPAAGGIKKAELYLESPVKREPAVHGNPVLPVLQPISQLLQLCSYVLLWKQPPLSAYVFIWLNISMFCHVVFGLTTLLSTTLTLLLVLTNAVMLEYSFSKSNVTCSLLLSLCGLQGAELETVPGAHEVSLLVVNSINSVCDVLLNIRDSSRQGQTQFWFALCTTVAMLTIILTYLASTTSFLVLFWFMFCFPAIKHHQLHKKITQEQVVNTFNMSMYMIYNSYLAVLRVFSTAELEITPNEEHAEFGSSLHEEYTKEMSEPPTSFRNTTMSYLRGLPSVMTLNWNRNWTGMFSRSALPPVTQQSTSTEEDSDFGIDDIDDDEPNIRRSKIQRSQTLDTLASDPGMIFPSLERHDTMEYEGIQTLAEGIDPNLLFDDEQTEFTSDIMGISEFGLTPGGPQQLHLLDAVNESDDELYNIETDGPPPSTEPEQSPTPEFGNSIVSSNVHVSRDGTLDGKQIMLPTPPECPKPDDSSAYRSQRLKTTSAQSDITTDTEFYVISDEEIRAADDEISSTGSNTSLREMISGRVRQISDNPRI